MKINVKSIKGTLGAKMDVTRSIDLEAREIKGQSIEFITPCQLKLMVINSDDKYIVSGPGEVVVKLPCSSCLTEVEKTLEFQFTEEVPKEDVVRDELDLTGTLDEYIRLALPMRVVCKEECQGLCPSCGADLNEEDCDCYMHEVDPRLAKLNQLLDD